MKKINQQVGTALMMAIIGLFTAIILTGCNEAGTSKEAAAKEGIVMSDSAVRATVALTNPFFTIAPVEYTDLSMAAFDHMSKFEFDAWGEMMADNVVYSFPDGDVDTRTTLSGKDAVVSWWKNWKEKSGVESMTLSEFNNIPINVVTQPKGGSLLGIYVISYFSNKLVFKGKPVAVRMNFTVHFNSDKKIDRYITYYDRSVIIKAAGMNALESMRPKK